MSAWVSAALGLVFLAVGAGALIAGVRALARRRAFLMHAERCEGAVVAFRERRDQDAISLYPVVRFRTLAGHEITFESQLGSESPGWAVGDRVPVRYRVDAPNQAEVDSRMALWGLGALLTAVGAAFAAVGLGVLAGWIPA